MRDIVVEDAKVTNCKYKPGRIEEGNKKVEGQVLVTIDLGDRPELIQSLGKQMGTVFKMTATQVQQEMFDKK